MKQKNRKKELENFYAKHKRMPSYNEMLKVFSVKSKNTAHYIINKLINQNVVSRDNKGYLSPINLLNKVKLLGSIKAGFPSPAEEELVDKISLDEFLINKKDATYMLKVSGDSMIDAGIHPNDLVLVERGLTPHDGDIIVAEIDNEWTLKRLIKKGKAFYLKAENPKYEPIYPKENLNLGGVVISVIRKYH